MYKVVRIKHGNLKMPCHNTSSIRDNPVLKTQKNVFISSVLNTISDEKSNNDCRSL